MKGVPVIKYLFRRCWNSPWGRFLVYWATAFKTGFDNLVRSRKTRVFSADSQDLCEGKPSESIPIFRDVIIHFDLCRPCGRKAWSAMSFFEEGFIRIGDRISPPFKGVYPKLNLAEWRRTDEPMPTVEEFAPGKTVIVAPGVHLDGQNVALVMRYNNLYLQAFAEAAASVGEEVLLASSGARFDGEVPTLMTRLFDVRRVRSGAFLFRKVIFFDTLPRLKEGRENLALLRSRLLTAFDVKLRNRVNNVGRITLISRRDWQEDPKRFKKIVRKISNEDAIIAALSEQFPAATVKKVSLERLPMKEQLSLIHRSDVLVSMHGAGLGFCGILPPNAGVLELFPAHFMRPYWLTVFYSLVVSNQGHYRRWINLNPRREFVSDAWALKLESGPEIAYEARRDFTEVPPSAVVRRVKALQRQIQEMAH